MILCNYVFSALEFLIQVGILIKIHLNLVAASVSLCLLTLKMPTYSSVGPSSPFKGSISLPIFVCHWVKALQRLHI